MKKLAAILLPVLCLVTFAHAETITLPLHKFTSSPSIEMRCMHGSQSLSIPVAERWNVRKAILSLHYTSSNNLLGDISQMLVRINGEPIEQLKLIPQAPGAKIDISIPVLHMKPGYNTIGFEVVQHYLRGQCEIPCAPDMWTNVSLTESTLQLEYDLKPLPLNLGEVAGMLFDPKQFPEGAVNIVSEKVTQDSVTLATIVASGIARRFDYRKVKFEFSDTIKQGMDNVLIGSESFAKRIAAQSGQPPAASDSGALHIYHLPNGEGGVDDKHALLAITGDKSETLKVVAETLASMTLPFPGTDAMHSHGFSMADITMYSGRQTITADKLYDFKTLNQPTYSFKGLNANPITLTFRLPPDFLIKQNQYAKLSLNIAYGAGLRPDSAVNVAINDKPLRAIQLDSASGSYIDGYKIDIPTYLFKPGSNKISFLPSFNMQNRQMCDALQDNGLFATIFENSTLYFPPMPHFVELPKIELFALNGFPFSRWPDGFETMIYLPKQDTASIMTALNMAGMITQKNGFPLFSVLVRFNEPTEWDGEMLVIGTAATIPKSIMDAAPMGLTGIANVPYPVSRGWDNEESPAVTKQQGGLGQGTGALMEFESPLKTGRTIILLTAESGEDLLQLGDAMLEPMVQGNLKGDVSLIKLTVPEYEVSNMAFGKKYTTGDSGNIPLIDSFLHKYHYVFYGLVVFIIIALGMLGFWALHRYRAKRMAGEKPSSGQ